MTREPIHNCPKLETTIRERVWTDEQRHAMFKYTADEVRTRFETWTSAQPWFKATIGFGRSGDEYADPCINSRWQGWWAAYAERMVDARSDAENWGVALNEAAWTFIDVCPEKSALLFNNVKQALRAAILKYLKKVTTTQQADR